VQRLLVLALSALACGAMGWQLALNGIETMAEGSTTMVLGWQLGYLNYAMSGLSVLSCLGVLALLARHLGQARRAFLGR
jgi:hypothetical protein